MPLRKSFAKRTSKEPKRDRRTKAQEENLSSSSMPRSSSILPGFTNKVIIKSSYLTLDFLEHEGFQFGKKLRNLGLEPFCSLNLLIYLNLIKEFHSVAVHFKSGFKGNLRGTEVVLTPSSISDFLHIPRHGDVEYMADPREEALNVVLDNEDSDLAIIISANDL